MSARLDRRTGQPLPLTQGRNAQVALLLRVVRPAVTLTVIGCLLVDCHIAGERHGISARAEHPATAFQIDRQRFQLGGFHLAGDKALPDKLIQSVLVRRQGLAHHGRLNLHPCRADRLVCVLRTGARLVYAGRFGAVPLTVSPSDQLGGGGLRLCGNAQGIGTHVGDKTLRAAQFRADVDTLVQFLRHAHDAGGLEIQLAGCFLLHGGSGKGRGRILPAGRPFDRCAREGSAGHVVHDAPGIRLTGQAHLALPVADKAHPDGFSVGAKQNRIHRPVFLRHKGADLVLPVHDQLGRHRLHTPGGQTAPHGLPQVRGQLIAHNAIQNTAGLLGIDQIHIQRAGLFDGRLDHGFGDLIECHALYLLHRDAQCIRKVPRDCLPLAVRVGCKKDLAGGFGFLTYLLDEIARAADIDIVCLKMILNVNAEGAFGKITDVTHRSYHLVVGAEIALDGGCL